MTQLAEKTSTHLAANGQPKILGFVCEWSLGRTDLIHEDGTVRGMEHVKTIKIPCSGFVKTEWVTLAFESGAQGMFVLGCPLGDCHFNEGNFIINDRLSQHVGRLTGRKVLDDGGRVAELYLGATDGENFTRQLTDFSGYIAALPPLVVTKKAKAAPKAAAAPAATVAKPAAPVAVAPVPVVETPKPVAAVTPAPVAPAIVEVKTETLVAPVVAAPVAPVVATPAPVVETPAPVAPVVVAPVAEATPVAPAAPAEEKPRSSKIKRWNPNQ